MKYIRTKNKIYIFDNPKKYQNILGIDFFEIGGEEICWNEIIKQADTIEELCDGLIVEEKENPNNWFIMEIDEFKNKDIEELKYTLNDWIYKFFIKTDKGLIYVAKMNDKEGVLELC